MLYCKVMQCRYSNTHVTSGHKCGVCAQYGHGEIECFNNIYINRLRDYYSDELPADKQCTVDGCDSKTLHTVDAHHCSRCGKREPHNADTCTVNKIYNIKCPLCRTENTITKPQKILGLTDTCAICMDANVAVLFPECSHCCVCFKCLDKL